MKVLVIPDVHLKPFMFSRATEIMKEGLAEKAVCLMDIADDWKKEFQLEEYVQTYDAAIRFAKMFPDSLWCYGNHDLCYVWDERESGYSYMAKGIVQQKLEELSMVLPQDNPIKYIQVIDDVLFCHGGISQYFVEKFIAKTDFDDVSKVVKTINALGHKEMWCDESPIWYRPQYYKGKMYKSEKCLQVVGHTPVERIDRYANIISSDVFSTYRDGTPIGTQEFLLMDTMTWQFYGVK